MQILSKQKNSEMCMICGMNNNYGVKAQFYNMEDGSVMTPFVFREEHQSYPGRVHGGIIKSTSKFLEAKAQILDIYGNVLATAEGKYIKMSTDKIMDEEDFHEGINFLVEDDRKEINFRK